MPRPLPCAAIVVAAFLLVPLQAWADGARAARPEKAQAVPSTAGISSSAEVPSVGAAAAAPEPDFSWASGTAGPSMHPLTAGPLSFELRLDSAVHYSFARPQDNTLAGSSEAFRHGEFQLTHVGFGGNLEYGAVQARLMLQLGLYSQTTARNDASVARGQWQLDNAMRYVSEAYLGYHFDVWSGVNLQAGLFMSYMGLWSYYNFDNWTYQPSYVSSNTPWYFNGLRLQAAITPRLKVEAYVVNGWQSYGCFNAAPGVGAQVLYRPGENYSIVSNAYVGSDTPHNGGRKRFHSDNSVLWRYRHRPGARWSKAAVSLTFDGGFEGGGGVLARHQYFLGAMAYHRAWFGRDVFALTVGGGLMQNPGRYLVLLPPINGATAASGSPYFSTNPRDPYLAWDVQAAFDVMPTPATTFRLEYTFRHASVPYFAGHGGMTPPGGNTQAPALPVSGWAPDLRRQENRLTAAFMVKM